MDSHLLITDQYALRKAYRSVLLRLATPHVDIYLGT
jgi:hypothetical protein